ncbi:MAG: FtsX-like permease family protein [Acidimicrobiales bacterium]|jgi:ABC-type lipoprotein release transport system permease subunit
MAVAVLISVVGGLVMAAAAAGRRTESAFPRFVAAHGFDAVVYANIPVPKVAKLPGVSSVTELVIPDTGQPTCNCARPISSSAAFAVEVVAPKDRSPFALISGRLPDPSATDQVLASFTLQQDYGVRIGTVIRVPFEAPSQASAYNNPNTGLPKPEGPTVVFRVVGIEATEFEFPSGTTPVYLLYATQAFARTVLPRTAMQYQYYVRLRQGAAGIPRFGNEANTLKLGTGTVGYSSEDGQAATIQASIHPQAIGWWILAVLAALVALAVLGQALARQSIVESEDYPTMAAVGVDRRQLVALGMVRSFVVGIAGAVGAVAIATALSPLAPLGEARVAEISAGVSFDTLVLPLGALATVAVVLVLGLWPAVRASRTLRTDHRAATSRPSAVVTHLAAMGAPPSAVIGVRNTLERRAGGATVPLGSALLGMVLAVIALCGTGVFGASLSHLTQTPRLYGEPEQLSFDPPNPTLLRNLEADPAVTGITVGVGAGEISINNVIVGAVAATAIRGPLLFSAVNGHLPNGDDQIGLGVTTMRQVGARVGSLVRITVAQRSGGKRTEPFLVVSQDSFPLIGGFVSLGTGAILTTAGLERAFCAPGPHLAACRQAMGNTSKGGVRVSFVPGPRGQAAIKHYLNRYSSITSVPFTPTSIVNFGEAVNFPLIFGAMLALFGAATLVHLLVVSVSRRRREIGLLKAVGFVNSQIASVVAWQATTLALVGIAIGVPLGIVVGRGVWMAFANNLGVVPVSVVPAWLIVGLAAGVLVVANLLAATPALAAARTKPGLLLRTM